jgi:hypothetical protein
MCAEPPLASLSDPKLTGALNQQRRAQRFALMMRMRELSSGLTVQNTTSRATQKLGRNVRAEALVVRRMFGIWPSPSEAFTFIQNLLQKQISREGKV